MWLFTPIGFFSVVQKNGEPHLTIRARSAPDLDRLREAFMPPLSATISKAGTDYPFRATIGRKDFTKGLAKLGEAIDYHNFKDEVAAKMGKARAHTYSKVWSTLLEIEEEKPAKAATIRSVAAKTGFSYVGVLFNQKGQVLLREPKNHFDGYVWTFPKGKPDRGETEAEAALREVREETGVEARIEKRIPEEFQGGTGKTIYFLMTPEKEAGVLDEETQSVVWVDCAEARRRIRQTTNAKGRERDLKVLQAAIELRS